MAQQTSGPQAENYERWLRELMSYLDGQSYPRGHEFATEQLCRLTPDDLYRWMALKAYGKENPTPDDKPTEGRSNSLAHYKKAISYFMPDRLTPWDETSKVGNPTRSAKVNDLIKAVRKKELRKQGKVSQADRPFEKGEFEQSIRILQSFHDNECRYQYPAMFKFQFHMIARLDDTSHLKKSALKPSIEYDFALTARLRWSKNLSLGQDAPDQILLGAMDARYCTLLALALHLEVFIGSGQGRLSPFVFVPSSSDPEETKSRACNCLKASVMDSAEFVREKAVGSLGANSSSKFGRNWPQQNGCNKDEVDYRARWKRPRRQRDDDADIIPPWPDVKVASTLCLGGPCKYSLEDGSGLSSDWLLEHVAPNIADCFDRQVALLLAKPLLWSVYDRDAAALVPLPIRERVVKAYNEIPEPVRLPNGVNPVKKVLLVASAGCEGEAHLDEVSDKAAEAAGGGHAGDRALAAAREQMLAMYARLTAVERRVVELQSAQQSRDAEFERRMEALERDARSLARGAIRRERRMKAEEGMDGEAERRRDGGQADKRAGRGRVTTRPPATLSPCPSDLYVLWEEYEFGVGGRKPAKLFTATERGKDKFKYSRRKLLWSAIERMVRAGHTSDEAIDKIYAVYGERPVTSLIKAMKPDEKNGGHPELK